MDQFIVQFLLNHSSVFLIVVYELWSLIPESAVASSSVLTLLARIIKSSRPE